MVEDEISLLASAGHEVHTYLPEGRLQGRLSSARSAARALAGIPTASRAADLARSLKPDVVHVHNIWPALSPQVFPRLTRQAPTVHTIHNYRFSCLAGTYFRDGVICEMCKNRFPSPGVRYRCYQGSTAASAIVATSLGIHRSLGHLEAPTLVCAVSEFVRQQLLDVGMQPDHVVVKRNFVHAAAPRTGPGEFFLYLGRLSAEKGLDWMVEAWSSIEAPLTIVGDGPLRGWIEDVARRRDAITYAGAVPAAAVGSFLQRARAVVAPSVWYETSGRGVLEAAAAGVPTIASRIGGLAEAVDHDVSGVLVTPRATVELAQAVRRLSDDEASISMGRAASNSWREYYGPERGLSALEEIYEEARRRWEALERH